MHISLVHSPNCIADASARLLYTSQDSNYECKAWQNTVLAKIVHWQAAASMNWTSQLHLTQSACLPVTERRLKIAHNWIQGSVGSRWGVWGLPKTFPGGSCERGMIQWHHQWHHQQISSLSLLFSSFHASSCNDTT